MKIVVTIFWVIVVAVLLGLFSLNVGQSVTIDLIFAEFPNVNLVTVVYLSVMTGFLLGMTLWLVRLIRDKREILKLKKQLRHLEARINSSTTLPEGDPASAVSPENSDGDKSDA